MANPLTSLTGFPRAPAQEDLRTRRALQRLAALAAGQFVKSFAQVSVAAGDTVANTVTETALASAYTYPANVLAPGNVLEIAARGVWSCVGPPTIRLKWKLGAAVLLDTGVLTPTSTATNALWVFNGLAIVDTVGASGTIEAQGDLRLYFTAITTELIGLVNTATISVDTTGTLLEALAWTWGTAAAGNTITQRQHILKTLP